MKQVSAHDQGADQGIAVTLHIDPADQPIVGKPTQFYFKFQDSTGSFEIQRCDCVITLLKDEIQIDQQPVAAKDSAFSSLGSQPLYSKIFTDAGSYELEFSGQPINGATFKPFTLNYEVLVVESGMSGIEHHTSLASEHIGHIIIFGVGFLAAIGLLIHNYYQNRRSRVKEIISKENISNKDS